MIGHFPGTSRGTYACASSTAKKKDSHLDLVLPGLHPPPAAAKSAAATAGKRTAVLGKFDPSQEASTPPEDFDIDEMSISSTTSMMEVDDGRPGAPLTDWKERTARAPNPLANWWVEKPQAKADFI